MQRESFIAKKTGAIVAMPGLMQPGFNGRFQKIPGVVPLGQVDPQGTLDQVQTIQHAHSRKGNFKPLHTRFLPVLYQANRHISLGYEFSVTIN